MGVLPLGHGTTTDFFSSEYNKLELRDARLTKRAIPIQLEDANSHCDLALILRKFFY